MKFHFALCSLFAVCMGKLVNFEEAGAKPEDDSLAVAWYNGALLNTSLRNLTIGDTFLIPNKTYTVMGGVQASGLQHITIQIDGTLDFLDNVTAWPRDSSNNVMMCFELIDIKNVTFTSAGKGTLNGRGSKWWGFPGIGIIVHGDDRPKLFQIQNGEDVLVENLLFLDSPYWTFWAYGMEGLEVRYCDIDVRRDRYDGHDVIDLSAANTDGFDVSGNNIWIHDCSVWNQDDCISCKGGTNMLFERISASGLGLTIGSLGAGTTRNITFRDCSMRNTFKGIYMKFNTGANNELGVLADVLYENIRIEQPRQWPIWIGPAQQSVGGDAQNICKANPCSLCWPYLPPAECNAPPMGLFANITLRNVTIVDPKTSPGVLLGPDTMPMQNILFEDVVVDSPGSEPWGDDYYACENVQGLAIGETWPVPPCFIDETSP